MHSLELLYGQHWDSRLLSTDCNTLTLTCMGIVPALPFTSLPDTLGAGSPALRSSQQCNHPGKTIFLSFDAPSQSRPPLSGGKPRKPVNYCKQLDRPAQLTSSFIGSQL